LKTGGVRKKERLRGGPKRKPDPKDMGSRGEKGPRKTASQWAKGFSGSTFNQALLTKGSKVGPGKGGGRGGLTKCKRELRNKNGRKRADSFTLQPPLHISKGKNKHIVCAGTGRGPSMPPIRKKK